MLSSAYNSFEQVESLSEELNLHECGVAGIVRNGGKTPLSLKQDKVRCGEIR